MKLTANRISKRLAAAVFGLLLAVVTGLGLSPLSFALDSNTPQDLISRLAGPIQNQPLAFEPYAAQNAPRVQFVSRTPGYTVFLGPRQATIAFTSVSRRTDLQQSSIAPRVVSTSWVRLRLKQSDFASAPVPEEPLRGKSNYFIGNDPARWRTNVSLFGRVRYPSVYKDVDLVYYGSRGQLEYDFVIRPGGEPQSISFSVDGASHAEIEHGGDLLMQAGDARVILHRPVAYQIIDTQRREVSARFLPLGGRRFGIRVAQYDHKSPLIIDPVLAYSTYLGGSDDEGIFGIGFDAEGNIYVAGETSSLNFPQKGGVQHHVGGNYDAFVSKFDPQGTNLIYSTYLGGAQYDHAVGIQVDAHGNAYLAGITFSSDFPVKNAWQPSLAGKANGFVAQLNPSGSELVFSTYLGGTGFDQITDLALDRESAVYVAGSTNSLDFPITANAFQTQCDGGAHTGFCIGDAFVAKFVSAGQKLVYSTYLGGTGYDTGAALAVDERGEAYIAGQTGSSNFPTKNPYQGSLAGGNDAFVTKLNAAGSGLVFSTFLGGTSFDGATGIALDRESSIYVTGYTGSTDFPLVRPFQAVNKGAPANGFITKFNPQASQLIYSTYVGGSGFDYPFRIAVNRHEDAALIGFTSSTDFPTYHALYPSYLGGATDAFVFLLDRSGQQPRFSTYLGGTGDEYGYAITIGCRNSVWVGGSTSSRDFPVVEAFQPAYAGGPFDAFLSRIQSDDGSPEDMTRSFSMSDGHDKDCPRAEVE